MSDSSSSTSRRPELRREACENEIRLNRRLARDVYQGVVARHAFGSGDAVTKRGRHTGRLGRQDEASPGDTNPLSSDCD